MGRNIKPQVPGEPIKQYPQEPAGEVVFAEAEAPETFAQEGPAPATEETFAEEPKPEVEPAPAKRATRPAGELPDQSEVDPATITRSVLTKQGWVCPLKVGPAAKV